MPTTDIVEIVSKIITALATVLAGGWAYYRFVKGRVFKSRLTLAVTARRLRIHTTEYVLATIELSNVGLSKIDIEGATLRVCSLSGNAVAGTVSVPKRTWLETFKVLLAHSWIESGEALKEQSLLVVGLDNDLAIVLDCRVVAGGASFTAMAIAEPPETEASSASKRSLP